MQNIAAKAICFKEASTKAFFQYQKQVIKNAKIMSKIFTKFGFKIISKGTDNHLFLLNLTPQNITGKDADIALNNANITVNKNTIPNDKKSAFITSGLRIGTPAITTRGFKESEVTLLTTWICNILKNISNKNKIQKIKNNVFKLCLKFPVYNNK